MKYKYPILLIAVFTILMACTEDFEEINTDPNLITADQVSPDAILTFVLKESIFNIVDLDRIGAYAGFVSSASAGFPLQQIFGGFDDYRSSIVNIKEVERLTADDPSLSNKNAIAKIWRVWLFYRISDNMGDVPYTEAGLGVDDLDTKPVYDTQEFIYNDLLNTLKESAAQLSDNPDLENYGDTDILFQGDVDSWKRFANSLRLRLAMRVRYVDAAIAQKHINEVINAPLIDSNAQNAEVTAEGDEALDNANRGPFYNLIQNNSENSLAVSMSVSENLLKRDDPRLTIYLSEAPTGGYRARPFNLVSEDQKPRYDGDSIATVGDTFRVSAFSFKVVTSAEVKFLKAEAALAGIVPGDAAALFREGIQDAMELYEVPQAEIDTFLSGPWGTLDGTQEEQLEEIITQKYLAMFYESHEGWAEYRRTGYPLIWIGKGPSDTGGELPRRQMYPLDEYAKNKENVESAVAKLSNGDDPMSKIWWDAKPGLPFAHPRQGLFPPEIYE